MELMGDASVTQKQLRQGGQAEVGHRQRLGFGLWAPHVTTADLLNAVVTCVRF